MPAYRIALISLGVGLLYYFGAFLGVTSTSLPSGIAILWPPNAILLAAMLSFPTRYWPYLAASVLVAEVAADYPFFTVTEAVLFGLVNIGECTLGAALIRRLAINGAPTPDWDEPWELALFILVVFFVVSPLAAVFGASIHAFLINVPTPLLSLWQIWWLGDASGLIALTPAFHILFNLKRYSRDVRYRHVRPVEWLSWACIAAGTSYLVFSLELISAKFIALTPLLVMIAPFWAALRFGPLPTSLLAALVACYAAIATAAGAGPFVSDTPEKTALLTQEVLTLFTVIVLFAAAFVSQSHRKSRNLRLYKSAVESTGEGVLITEAANDQPIIYCNDSFLSLTGYRRKEILGCNCRFLNAPEHDQEQVGLIREAVARCEAIRITLRNFSKDGTLFWNNLVINPIHDQYGRTTHFVGILSDITSEVNLQQQMGDLLVRLQYANDNLEEKVKERTNELEAANQKLQRQALTDELTGVKNRRDLISQGHFEVMRSRRSGRSFALMILDIDHFKVLNDQYGHEAGDYVLQAFARAVDASIRKIDSFGRWGGEEFMVIVADADQTDLTTMARKILDRVAKCRIEYQGSDLQVTASLGIARWHESESFDQLVSRADRALYQAKESGRNCHVLAEESPLAPVTHPER